MKHNENEPTIKEKANIIFFQLVNDNTDLVGMVAYSIYKRFKIEYITKHKKDHMGVHPSDDVIKEFRNTIFTKTTVDNLRKEAESSIKTFMNENLKDRAGDLDRRAKENKSKEDTLSAREKKCTEKESEIREREIKLRKMTAICPKMKLSHHFWLGVAQSALGTLTFSVLSILIIIITKWPVDLLKAIAEQLSK